MQEAPAPYPEKNEIYKKYEKYEKTFELENVHNFLISYNNYQNKFALFNFKIGLYQNNIYIISKEKKDFNINEYKSVLNLDNLILKNKQFKSYDNINDAFNQILKLFEREKIIIKYFSEKEMKLEIKLLNFTGEEEKFDIMLYKQEINKDSLIQELIDKVIFLQDEINNLKQNNILEKEILELKKEKNRQAQEIENLKQMVFLLTNDKNIKLNNRSVRINNQNVTKKKSIKIKYKIKSSIITDNSLDFVIEKIQGIYPINNLQEQILDLPLLYRGSENNFETEIFHSKCDKVKGTLTLIKNDKGFIFGGFTSEAWEGNNIAKKDDKAFCFSINLKKIYNIFKGKDAIKCNINYGPIFLNDIFGFRKYNLMIGECSEKKACHYLGSMNDYEINGGMKEINVDEIEIFEVNL